MFSRTSSFNHPSFASQYQRHPENRVTQDQKCTRHLFGCVQIHKIQKTPQTETHTHTYFIIIFSCPLPCSSLSLIFLFVFVTCIVVTGLYKCILYTHMHVVIQRFLAKTQHIRVTKCQWHFAMSHPLHHLLRPLPHPHLPLLLLRHFPDPHFPHYPDKTVLLLLTDS